MKAARKLRRLQHPQSLMEHLRQFLTPQVWKQARQAVPRGRSLPRWDLQPLVIIMLALTWAAGDSQEEKFETARGYYVASHEARKRPGKIVQGIQKALSRVPMRNSRRWPRGCAIRSGSASPSGCWSTASNRWAAMVPESSVHGPRNWKPASDKRARTTRPRRFG